MRKLPCLKNLSALANRPEDGSSVSSTHSGQFIITCDSRLRGSDTVATHTHSQRSKSNGGCRDGSVVKGCILLSQRTQMELPAHILGESQLPVTAASGDLGASCVCRCSTHIYTLTHRHVTA